MSSTSRRRIGVIVLAILLGTLVGIVPAISVATAGKPLPAQLAFDFLTHDYGSVTVGQTSATTFTLSNPGGKSANSLTVNVSGSGMSITATSCGKSLRPAATCDVTVTFAPEGTGSFTGTLTASARGVSPATVALTGTGAAAAADRYLYWANPDIGRALLDGTSANAAFVNPDGGVWVIEVGGGYVYWFYYDALWRIPVTGTADPQLVVDVTAAGGGEIQGIAVAEPYLYWTDYSNEEIWRANLDGSGAAAIVTGLDNPEGLDIDGGYIYWSQYSGAYTSKILRASLSDLGSTPELLYEYPAEGTKGPRGLEVGGGRVYWAEDDWNLGGGSVLSVPVAGGETPQVHVAMLAPNRVDDVALDTEGGWLYYTANVDDDDADWYDSSIARRKLDGTGDEQTVVPALEIVYGLAIG